MTSESANQPIRLTAIELENFKGIGEPVRLELKPITLLFGANSAGKSTILQALQYVREVLERRNANPDRTLHGGDFVDLGGFATLVHGHDLSRRLGITLEIALNGAELPDLVPESFEDWHVSDGPVLEFYNLLQGIKNRFVSVAIHLEIAWSSIRRTAIVVVYEVYANGSPLALIHATGDGRNADIRIQPSNPVFQRPKTAEEIAAERSVLADLGSVTETNAETPSQELSPIDPVVNDYQAISSTLEEFGIIQERGQGLRQWLSGIDGALPSLEPLLYTPTGAARGAEAIYIAREFTAFLTSTLVGPAIIVRNCLRGLRYLGPIRHVPKRDFEAALTPDEARWADGLAAWECLMTGEDSLVQTVSDWMSSPDKLNAGYEIERRTIREVPDGLLNWVIQAEDTLSIRARPDVLAELETAPSKRHIDLIEIRSGLRVQPRDVGIGISQVLPVVVAALQPSAGLVAIEQPELHIHPAVQVALGDLFVRATTDNGSLFLIETHSEHLILRLLRRIRETTEGELPPGLPALSPDHVGVIYVERGEAGVRLTALPIDASGEFTSRWPQGFFNEREREFFGNPPTDIEEQAKKLFPK